MVAPLLAGQTVKGAMAVWRTGGQPFERPRARVPGRAVAAGGGGDRERAPVRRGGAARGRARTVNTVSQELAGKLDVGALLELVGEQIRELFKADVAYVALLDRATDMIDFPYQYGEAASSRSYGEGLTSKIIDTGKALIINTDVDRRAEGARRARRRQGRRARTSACRSRRAACRGRDQRAEHAARGRLRRRRRAPAGHDRRQRRRRAAERAALPRGAGGARRRPRPPTRRRARSSRR